MKVSGNTQYLASFMIGIGSILNIAPACAQVGQVGSLKNDSENLKKDWQTVGSYLYNAMEQVNNDRATLSKIR